MAKAGLPFQVILLASTHCMNAAGKRIPELDGLRGLAIAAVMCFHAALYFPVQAGTIRSLMLFGWSGVDLFFVISGFLIGGILVDHRESTNYFSAFYARRFFRIIPLYFGVIAAYGFCWSMGGGIRHDLVEAVGKPMHWYTYLSFTNNIQIAAQSSMGYFLPVSWSLAVEEQFYLTLPVLVWLVAPRYLGRAVVSVIAIVVAARAIACGYELVSQNQAYVLPWFRADALLIGVTCALLFRNQPSMDWIRSHRTSLVAVLALLGCSVVAVGTGLPHWTASPKSPVMMFGLTLVALMYAALLLLCIAEPPKTLSRVLSIRPLRWVGKVSYCVYLVHQAAFAAVTALLLPALAHRFPASAPWLTLAIALTGIFVVAYVSWRFFESRMIRLGHRYNFERAAEAETSVFEPIEPEYVLPAS